MLQSNNNPSDLGLGAHKSPGTTRDLGLGAQNPRSPGLGHGTVIYIYISHRIHGAGIYANMTGVY